MSPDQRDRQEDGAEELHERETHSVGSESEQDTQATQRISAEREGPSEAVEAPEKKGVIQSIRAAYQRARDGRQARADTGTRDRSAKSKDRSKVLLALAVSVIVLLLVLVGMFSQSTEHKAAETRRTAPSLGRPEVAANTGANRSGSVTPLQSADITGQEGNGDQISPDDGYLILHDGRIYSGSDWIPEWTAITTVGSERMLVVRYPIRTKGDLLPVQRLEVAQTVEMLMRHLSKQQCPMDSATAQREIVRKQLTLDGTFTLHSETAKKNGGDYDFDWICVVEGNRFPPFVEDRFEYRTPGENTKNKQNKKESPWWNLPQVAYSAKGNAIGAITDLKTSCLAAGRTDLADQCAIELQKALDQLKWGVEPDQEAIAQIRQQVGTAPWLKLKRIKRVSDLPMQIETASTDRIGALYNFIRKELDDFFSDVRPTEDFRGAICGGTYDRDMQSEAGTIVRMYGMNISLLLEKRAKYEHALSEAQQALDDFPAAEARASQEGSKRRKELIRKRNQAQAALHFFEERCGRDIRNLINIVRKWAERKEDRALDWLTALWDYSSRSRRADNNRPASSGSIAFYAFPQHLVDQVVEKTGGRPITVALPKLIDGEISIDPVGNVYLVDEAPDGNGSTVRRETLIVQIPGDGRMAGDGRRPYQTARFAVQPGPAQVSNGRLILPNTQQRPGVPKPQMKN